MRAGSARSRQSLLLLWYVPWGFRAPSLSCPALPWSATLLVPLSTTQAVNKEEQTPLSAANPGLMEALTKAAQGQSCDDMAE